MITTVEHLIEDHLHEYLETLHCYSIYSTNDNVIHITGKKKSDDVSDFILLRLIVSVENNEFLIPNIFLPPEDRRKRIGLNLIAFVFQIAQQMKYDLALVSLTDGFRDKMLSLGAIETHIDDCLQIVETTDLK